MKRNKTKLIKLIMTMVLAMILMFSLSMPAFAAGVNTDGVLEGTGTGAPHVTIAKVLRMPIYTTTPTVEFTFTVTPQGYSPTYDLSGDYVPYNTTTPNMPAHASVTIPFTAADTGTSTANNRTTGIKTVVKEAVQAQWLFANTTFTKAGLYVYEVAETAGVAQLHNDKDYRDWMFYSGAKYKIEVWVMESETTPGTYYIKAIGTKITANLDSWYEDDNPAVGDKADPTPGELRTEGTTWDAPHSEMIFTNIYVKDNSGNDPKPQNPWDPEGPGGGDDDTVFKLFKNVTNGGNTTDKYFPFNITITKPAIGVGNTVEANKPEPQYKAYVMQMIAGVPTVVTATNTTNGTPTGTDAIGTYFLFTSGASQTVSLKHGQWLAFIGVQVGSKIAVTETAQADYKASYTLVLKNDGPVTATGSNSNFNTLLGFPVYKISNTEYGDAYIGEPVNHATFTNAYKDITTTGVSVDNLPYYALIGAALLVFIAFMAIRLRKDATPDTR